MGDRDTQRRKDEEQLQRLGYAQQLLREMGGFSNFALSFSIISILTGGVTLYGHGLRFGGPLVVGLGWPLVAVMTLFVAASLAQLSSSFPTAGALYHWSAILGGPGWGFFTAWLNTLGQFAITAAIDYGLAEFVVGMLGWPADRTRVLPVYAAILLSHAVLNHVGVKAVALLNWVSAWYHLVGVAALVAALALLAPKQELSFLFTRFQSEPTPTYLYGFWVGLLQAGWTFTGYDASAHVTEETVDPSRNAPWGIFLSVAVSAVAGYAMLIAVTLAVGDPAEVAAASNPFIHVLTSALGRLGSVLVWLVIGAMWFCGLSSVTSNSRMLFAFARDGGLPFSPLLARVSARFQSPHVAVWASVLAAFLVAMWADVYSAMAALSTIALYVSYALPIAVGWWARSNGRWSTRGPWDLGRFSSVVNAIALVWVATITVLFVLPPNQLAGYTFAGSLLALAGYWFGYMRTRFAGPKVKAEDLLLAPAVVPARSS
ncbi:MAG: amino acid permease [Myxococcota bacterium]